MRFWHILLNHYHAVGGTSSLEGVSVSHTPHVHPVRVCVLWFPHTPHKDFKLCLYTLVDHFACCAVLSSTLNLLSLSTLFSTFIYLSSCPDSCGSLHRYIWQTSLHFPYWICINASAVSGIKCYSGRIRPYLEEEQELLQLRGRLSRPAS